MRSSKPPTFYPAASERRRTLPRGIRGFTLVEVTIALVVLAMLSAFCLPFFGKSLTRSSDAVAGIQKSAALRQVMENIIADYNSTYKSNIAGLKTKINNTAGSGYGTYAIVFNDCINFSSGTEASCSGCTCTPCTNCPPKMLKVTIQDSTTGETLTYLFTQ